MNKYVKIVILDPFLFGTICGIIQDVLFAVQEKTNQNEHGGKTMRYQRAACIGLALTVLWIHFSWAETKTATQKNTKKESKKIEEAVRKKQIEKEKELKAAQEKEKQIEHLTAQQQFVEEHNKRVQETMDRAQFAKAVLRLPKDSFKVDEKIDVVYVLKNGANRGYWIDGRKFSPTYTIKDAKGNTVLTVGKAELHLPPKKTDLILLKSGEAFEPAKVSAFSLSKPGDYILTGNYALLRPEEENPTVWYGVITPSRALQIVEEKK